MADPQWVTRDGAIIEAPESVVKIAEEITWRFPDLQLGYLNFNDPDADLSDPPWVVYKKADRSIVLTAWECDDRIIERLLIGQDPQRALQIMRLHEEAAKAERKRKFDDIRAENRDVMEHAFRSPKTTWSFENREGEVVKITDDPKGVS